MDYNKIIEDEKTLFRNLNYFCIVDLEIKKNGN